MTDGWTCKPTDGQILLKRCEDASKKSELSLHFFVSWRNIVFRVFFFSLGMVGKVGSFLGQNETSDEIHTQGSLDNFLSNGETQTALG